MYYYNSISIKFFNKIAICSEILLKIRGKKPIFTTTKIINKFLYLLK
jgi:hypothetical protein